MCKTLLSVSQIHLILIRRRDEHPIKPMTSSQHAYEVRPCDKIIATVDLISDALPFGRASSVTRTQVRADP
jgi:hypothetical protein